MYNWQMLIDTTSIYIYIDLCSRYVYIYAGYKAVLDIGLEIGERESAGKNDVHFVC